jgi:hypothetical protein
MIRPAVNLRPLLSVVLVSGGPFMRTSFRLGSFCLLSSLAVGCTITESDPLLDDAGETSVIADDGTDTQVTDTGTPETDAAPTFAVIIQANALVGGTTDDVRDYGGGSTYSDIAVGGRIYEAYAVYEGTPRVESTRIGNATTGSGRVDGRLIGLPTDKGELTFTVTGYLRGLNGNAAAVPSVRVPWARTTCKATPSKNADVIATCATKLALIPDLKGIVFSSDVLPDGYCAGKGATDFELLRARTPAAGTAVVSKTTNDCQGVVFVPESEFAAQEVTGITTWGLSAEVKSATSACSLITPCRVDRKTGTDKLDIYVVGSACQLTNTSTGGTCF